MAISKKLIPAARREAPSREEILRILEERAQSAQHELARQTDAGPEVLDYLASNGAAATRRAVAANPAAPAATNRKLAEDEDAEVRSELARKIARLMPDLSADETDHLRAITIETLERLARDQETRVRAVLADGIKALPCIPKNVVMLLAHDVEEIVAGPILEYSPLLSDADLVEIIATARAEEKFKAIARRHAISPELADAIIGSLDIPAVAALLANPKARIREQTLDQIAAEAEAVEAWHAPLALRTDLSQRAIRRIANFVGSDLIEKLAERRGLDADTQSVLKRELRQRLEQSRDAVSQNEEKAAAVVSAAWQSGKLDEAFVESAVETGSREILILALAELARVPPETVRRILKARNGRPITALVWRAGLSMRLSFRIQSMVMHLAAAELLPARGGIDFPLTEEEMRWHLSYFEVRG